MEGGLTRVRMARGDGFRAILDKVQLWQPLVR